MHLKHKGSIQIPPRTANLVPNGFEQSEQIIRSPPKMSILASLTIKATP